MRVIPRIPKGNWLVGRKVVDQELVDGLGVGHGEQLLDAIGAKSVNEVHDLGEDAHLGLLVVVENHEQERDGKVCEGSIMECHSTGSSA